MLATLSAAFISMSDASAVLPPEEKAQVAAVLEEDAQVLSNTAVEAMLAAQPEPIRDEVIRINNEARPFALQVALLVPLIAGLVGFFNSFRMMKLPDVTPSAGVEGILGG